MKMSKKTIIAAIMLVGGSLILFSSFAISGFNINKLSSVPPFEEKTYVTEEKITSIQVIDFNVPVELRKSSQKEMKIVYFENEWHTYTIENHQGSLKIQKNRSENWVNNFFTLDFNSYKNKLIIDVPQDFFGTMEIETSNAHVLVDNLDIEKAMIKTSNGKVTVSETTLTGDFEIVTSNASVQLDSVEINSDSLVHTSNGKILASDVQIGQKGKFQTSNAGVEIKDSTADVFDLKTSSGSVDLTGIVVKERIIVQTSNGSILLSQVDTAKSIECITSNGSVRGTVVGAMEDFSITSKTSNGSNNLPSQTNHGEKSAVFKTSNANINIDFTQ